uniref:Transposon MuDR mudrA n=1 Tax=Solanum tuberosum TaxID=4113 RepID=M1DSM1_SOLTU
MAATIVILQIHYGDCFVYNPELRYSNGTINLEKINIDVDELHIMLFHKLALKLNVENVETFEYGPDVSFSPQKDRTDVSSSPQKDRADVSSSPQKDRTDVSSYPQKDRADVSSSPQKNSSDMSSSQSFDENEDRDLNEYQSLRVEDQPPRVEEHPPRINVELHSDFDSLYDVDENINDLSNLDEELL